jgi:hypothetical protein
MNGSTIKTPSPSHRKQFVTRLILACCLFFSHATQGFSEPCAPLKAFSNAMGFDRNASGQLVSKHDCDGDGQADYRSFWTGVEFSADPLACQDPYDPRHLVVPRSGYYRVLAEPMRVEVLFMDADGVVKQNRDPLIPLRGAR